MRVPPDALVTLLFSDPVVRGRRPDEAKPRSYRLTNCRAGASPADPGNGKRERLPYKTRAAAHTHSLLPFAYRAVAFAKCGSLFRSLRSLNGANGMSDMEGKVTRVGARERGQRTSFKSLRI